VDVVLVPDYLIVLVDNLQPLIFTVSADHAKFQGFFLRSLRRACYHRISDEADVSVPSPLINFVVWEVTKVRFFLLVDRVALNKIACT